MAEQENVQILKYDIIYNLFDEVKKLLSGLLEPEVVEVELGTLQVKGIFYTKKKEMIIGGKVTSGVVQNKAKVRIERNGRMIGEGTIGSLQRGDKAADQVPAGNECGIRFESKIKIEIDDILKAYKIETRMRTLEVA